MTDRKHVRGLTPYERVRMVVPVGDPSDCWIWPFGKIKGHGIVSNGNGRNLYVHRVVYENEVGPIDAGLHIHHACENPACCNPAHLEAVTPGVHRVRHRKGHCEYGHPFSGENLFVTKTGKRVCRTCMRKSQREFAKAKRIAAGGNDGPRRGSTNPTAKLNEAEVVEIRRRYAARELNQYELADAYGVTVMTVNRIVNRKTWTHI